MTDSRKDTGRICQIEGCLTDMKRGANGLCHKHNYRLKKYGDPLSGKPASGTVWRYLVQFMENYKDTDDCIPWPYGRDSFGYGVVTLPGERGGVHRIVCRHFHGEPVAPRNLAAHSCGNGHLGCMNPKHLRWATSKENSEDRERHGNTARGESCGSAKLTEQAVRDIRNSTESLRTLAVRHGLTIGGVFGAKSGKNWRHLA